MCAKSSRCADGTGLEAGIGRRLAEIVAEIGTREAAGEVAGVKDITIRRWIQARTDVSVVGAARLAEKTGHSLDWLAYGLPPVRRFTPPDPEGYEAGDDDALYAEILRYFRAFLARKGWSVPERALHRLAEDTLPHLRRQPLAEVRAALVEFAADTALVDIHKALTAHQRLEAAAETTRRDDP
jgi:hypothetical protein